MLPTEWTHYTGICVQTHTSDVDHFCCQCLKYSLFTVLGRSRRHKIQYTHTHTYTYTPQDSAAVWKLQLCVCSFKALLCAPAVACRMTGCSFLFLCVLLNSLTEAVHTNTHKHNIYPEDKRHTHILSVQHSVFLYISRKLPTCQT